MIQKTADAPPVNFGESDTNDPEPVDKAEPSSGEPPNVDDPPEPGDIDRDSR